MQASQEEMGGFGNRDESTLLEAQVQCRLMEKADERWCFQDLRH